MNTLAWKRFFDERQAARHGKRLFTVTELAHVAGQSPTVINVAMGRLIRVGVIERYARGLYAVPGPVPVEEALPWIDAHAYLTGAWALFRHGLITQIPRRMTCFTDRRPFRLRRATAAGELEMIVTAPPVYAPPSGAVIAAPEQALCDLAWIAARRGGRLAGVYTFRNLDRLSGPVLRRHRKRYPESVARLLAELPGRPGAVSPRVSAV